MLKRRGLGENVFAFSPEDAANPIASCMILKRQEKRAMPKNDGYWRLLDLNGNPYSVRLEFSRVITVCESGIVSQSLIQRTRVEKED